MLEDCLLFLSNSSLHNYTLVIWGHLFTMKALLDNLRELWRKNLWKQSRWLFLCKYDMKYSYAIEYFLSLLKLWISKGLLNVLGSLLFHQSYQYATSKKHMISLTTGTFKCGTLMAQIARDFQMFPFPFILRIIPKSPSSFANSCSNLLDLRQHTNFLFLFALNDFLKASVPWHAFGPPWTCLWHTLTLLFN